MKSNPLAALFSTLFFLFVGQAYSQSYQHFTFSFTNSYIVSGLTVQKVVEVFNPNLARTDGYVVLSTGNLGGNWATQVAKFRKNGQLVWSHLYYVLSGSGPGFISPQLYGQSVAADWTPSGRIAVGGYFDKDGSSPTSFVLMLNSDGIPDPTWAPGGQAIYWTSYRGVDDLLFSHNGTGDVVCLSTDWNGPGGGRRNPVLTEINSTGIVRSMMINDANGDYVDVDLSVPNTLTRGVPILMSLGESVTNQMYYIVGSRRDYSGGTSTENIGMFSIDWNFTNFYGYHYNTSSNWCLSNKIKVDESSYSGAPTLYITGACNSPSTPGNINALTIKCSLPSSGAIVKTDDAYWSPTTPMLPNSFLESNSVDILKEKDALGNYQLMFACTYYDGGTATYNMQMYPFSNPSTGPFPTGTVNGATPVPPGANTYLYSSVTSTFDPEMYILTGNDQGGTKLAFTRTDDKLSSNGCGLPLQVNSNKFNGVLNVFSSFSINTYSTTYMQTTLVDPPTTHSVLCGCTYTDGKTDYFRAVNIPNFESWNKNATDINNLTYDMQIATSFVNGSSKNEACFVSVAFNGVVNFYKEYAHPGGSTTGDEARAIKRLSNGDYAIAGIATNGDKELFVMRVSNLGAFKWYIRAPFRGTGCEFSSNYKLNHVYITELASGDLAVAGDMQFGPVIGGGIVVASVNSTGTAFNFCNVMEPMDNSNVIKRYDVQLTGITALSSGNFVVCGSAGNAITDYNAAMLLNFTSAGALSGSYFFRHQLSASYNFGLGQNNSSYACFNDVKEDGTNLVAVGFVSNCNAYYMNENYVSGLFCVIPESLTGAPSMLKSFPVSAGHELDFMGVTVTAPGTYGITGKWGTGVFNGQGGVSSPNYSAFYGSTTGTVLNAYVYTGGSNMNDVNCAYAGTGYLYLTGLTNDVGGAPLPAVYSVNTSGNLSCSQTMFSTAIGETNAAPTYLTSLISSSSLAATTETLTASESCTPTIQDLCSSSTAPVQINNMGNGTQGTEAVSGPSSAIKVQPDAQSARIYPNPVLNNASIDLNMEADDHAFISVYDLNGRELLRKNVNVVAGMNHFDVNMQDLSKGFYMVKISTENKNINTSVRIEKY